jgi:ferredoxin
LVLSGGLPCYRGRLLGRSQATSATLETAKRGGRAQVRSDLVKIILSADRCTGHGRCYSLAPELFDSDDEGHSVLIASEVPAGLEAQAKLAVENCPEACIGLED